MRIVGTQIQQILAAYLTKAGPSAPEPTAERNDEVTVSERAGAILKARQAFDALPETRTDRVADLRARIREGSYNPDDARIARAMLSRVRSGSENE